MIIKHKEFSERNEIRSDCYDGRTIYEWKSFNPRATKSSVKQLKEYQVILGRDKIARLEFY